MDLRAYRKNGFALVRRVFDTSTIELLQHETDALVERASQAGRKTEATWRGAWRETAGLGVAEAPATTRVDSIHNVQNHSAVFTGLLTDPRLVDLVAEVIGPNGRSRSRPARAMYFCFHT